jgi:hypothetical protein
MRFQFLIMPAALVASAPAVAEDFLTVREAQALIFPGASFTPADVLLTDAQVQQLLQASGATVYHSKIKTWKVSTGGWFVLDQVQGRDDIITYAIGLDDNGAVVGIEVLVCASGYDNVRDHKWLDLFKSRRSDTAADLPSAIPNVSGATLSATHITAGVRRVLTSYALFFPPKAAN